MFIKKLTELVSRKCKEKLNVVAYDITCKPCYAFLESCYLCKCECARKLKSYYEYKRVDERMFIVIELVKVNNISKLNEFVQLLKGIVSYISLLCFII